MEMNGKLTAMDVNSGKPFRAVATLIKGGRSCTASFTSEKDLPAGR